LGTKQGGSEIGSSCRAGPFLLEEFPLSVATSLLAFQMQSVREATSTSRSRLWIPLTPKMSFFAHMPSPSLCFFFPPCEKSFQNASFPPGMRKPFFDLISPRDCRRLPSIEVVQMVRHFGCVSWGRFRYSPPLLLPFQVHQRFWPHGRHEHLETGVLELGGQSAFMPPWRTCGSFGAGSTRPFMSTFLSWSSR